MADELNVLHPHKRCRHLLSKAMFVNAGLPPGEEAVGEDGNYWCGRNQTVYGPDDELCDADSCLDPSRRCYEAP